MGSIIPVIEQGDKLWHWTNPEGLDKIERMFYFVYARVWLDCYQLTE